MKTAISIPDPVFAAAEEMAKRLDISRSQLYTTALVRYLNSFNDDAITQVLNEVYADALDTPDSALLQMQFQSLPPEDW